MLRAISRSHCRHSCKPRIESGVGSGIGKRWIPGQTRNDVKQDYDLGTPPLSGMSILPQVDVRDKIILI